MRRNRRTTFLLFPLLLASFALPFYHAESQLRFYYNKLDASGYPTIRSYISVRYENKIRYDISESNFTVLEDGELMQPIRLTCPDPTTILPISVALVVDRSGSMRDYDRLEHAKDALKMFISLLTSYPSGDDEACLISFERTVTVDQGFTSDTSLLKYAIDSLTYGGGTNIWDAVIRAVMLTSSRATPLKAIILLSDGEHTTAFTATKQEAINAAKVAGIPIYTIGLSLSNTGPARRDLTELATETGGLFFDAITTDQLEDIYMRIANILSGFDRDCVLEYDTRCKDGTTRMVNITVNAFGKTATEQKSYTVALDSSTYKTLTLRIPEFNVTGGDIFQVPVYLDTPIPDTLLRGFTFIAGYNQSKLRFVRSISTGTLSDGLSVGATGVTDGTLISATGTKALPSQTGILVILEFEALDLPEDTTDLLTLNTFSFQQRCLKPQFIQGLVNITSRRADFTLLCSHPDSLSWNSTKLDYAPNPFVVSIRVRNTGPRDIGNIFATISYPQGFALDGNQSAKVLLTPNILTRNQEGFASWTVRALIGQLKSDTSRICITITTDKTPPQSCCFDIMNRRVGPKIAMTCDAPDTIFCDGKSYQPDPFRLRLRVHNSGDLPAAGLMVSLAQTKMISLASGERAYKALNPHQLFTNDSGYVEFWLTPHVSLSGGYDTLLLIVGADDFGPYICQRVVFIQAAKKPFFQTQCTMPAYLIYDEEKNVNSPESFDLIFTVKNTGTIRAEKVEARLAVHSNMTLADGEQAIKIVNGGTLDVGQEATIIWRVRSVLHPDDAKDTVLVLVTGTGGIADAFGSCLSTIDVEGVRLPEYSVSCSTPASIQFIDSVYMPDPFEFVFTVKNEGRATAKNVEVYLLLPPSLTLASGESALKTTATTRLDTATLTEFRWKIKPLARANGDTLTICARIDGSNAKSKECCSRVYIPPVTTAAFALQCSAVDSIDLISDLGAYSPNPFPISVKIRNVGARTAEKITATIMPLTGVLFSPAITQSILLNLNPGEETTVNWQALISPRAQAENLRFQILVEAYQAVRTTCEFSVFIPALTLPQLAIRCIIPDTILYDKKTATFRPDPIVVQVHVKNEGSVTAQEVQVLCTPSAGMQLAANDSALKFAIPSVLRTGETGTATFLVSPLRNDLSKMRSIRCATMGKNIQPVECSSNTFILGAPRAIVLTLLKEYVVQFKDQITIPLFIDQTTGKDITNYEITLTYDPSIISFVDATYFRTLTDSWYTTRAEIIEPGKVRITSRSSTPLTGEGILCNLTFIGVYDPNMQSLEIVTSPLHFEIAEVNHGDVDVTTIDGAVTSMGGCLTPLVAQPTYQLHPNTPNPFNPETNISFTVPEETHVVTDVTDTFGRVVATLAAKTFPAGRHVIRFNAIDLPGGMYFYRMRSEKYTRIRSMILTK